MGKLIAQDYLPVVLILPALYFLHNARSLTGLERLEQIKYAGFVAAAVAAVRMLYFGLCVNYHDRAVYLAEITVGSTLFPLRYEYFVAKMEARWKTSGFLQALLGWFPALWLLLVAYQKVQKCSCCRCCCC